MTDNIKKIDRYTVSNVIDPVALASDILWGRKAVVLTELDKKSRILAEGSE